jgi:hypothetical protein
MPCGEGFQRGATDGKGFFSESTPIIFKEIESEKKRWRLLRKLSNPALSRVDALQQMVERKLPAVGHHELAVQDEAFGREGEGRLRDFRKIAPQILPGFRDHVNLSAVARQQAAKAVPFGFVFPDLAAWDAIDRPRFHHASSPERLARSRARA